MKHTNSTIFLLFFISILASSPLLVNATTLLSPTIQINAESFGISPRSDDIRWIYQTIGKQTYRRQFNYTRNVWIGNWEPYP